HLLGEILDTSDRIVVMRDGKVVAADTASAFDRARLVRAMGDVEQQRSAARADVEAAAGERPLRVRAKPARQEDGKELTARQGEIVGLAGLAGHGQTQLLLDVFRAASAARPGVEVGAPVALVAGDRQADGIFPLWSIAENIGIRSLGRLREGLLISQQREQELA